MRKILLGSTAVLAAALASGGAFAQERVGIRAIDPVDPSYSNYGRLGGGGTSANDINVRIGGSFMGFYSHYQGSNPNGFNNSNVVPPGANLSQASGGANGGVSGTAASVSTKTGKNDLLTDAEVHVYVDGKVANGLRYGAVIELGSNVNEGQLPVGSRRTFSQKTMMFVDEMWAFVAFPGLGQLRMGDEDGILGGLMNSGVIGNFGTGGIYGIADAVATRPNRTMTGPGQLGDSTKVIYLSPQLFGFDVGVSWAPNNNDGFQNGCVGGGTGNGVNFSCDRTYAFSGATANSIALGNGYPQRRNENQAAIRYRTEIAGVGIAATIGHIGWQPQLDMTTAGSTRKTMRDGNVWHGGVQLSAFGFTAGANYQKGSNNYFWGSVIRGDKNSEQIMGGVAYTMGPITVGGNAFTGEYVGTSGLSFNTTTGAMAGVRNPMMRRFGYATGANYRLAPGLDLVAEWVHHEVHQRGVNLIGSTGNGSQDRIKGETLLLGTRLAF